VRGREGAVEGQKGLKSGRGKKLKFPSNRYSEEYIVRTALKRNRFDVRGLLV
jgi:hypothetical protein